MAMTLFLPTVPEGVGARAVLLLRHGRVYAAQSVLRGHQETRVSASGSRQEIHEEILFGELYIKDPFTLCLYCGESDMTFRWVHIQQRQSDKNSFLPLVSFSVNEH